MRDLVIWFRTNFLVKRNLFKSKNENFLIGNKKKFLLAKIDINESVIKIVKIISKILLEKYLNLNNLKSHLVIATSLLRRSKIVLTLVMILKKKNFNIKEKFLDLKIKKIYYSQKNLGKVYFLIKKFLLIKKRIL